MSSCSLYEKKEQQTGPHSEDKKKKQHKLNTNVSRIEYTP